MNLQKTIRNQLKLNFNTFGSNTLFDIVDSRNISHPFTYKGFIEGAGRAASVLSDVGVQPGDRVLICMSHQTALFLGITAVIHSGAVPVVMTPPNPKISDKDYGEMLQTLIAEIEPRITIVDEGSLPFVEPSGSTVLGASDILQTARKKAIQFRSQPTGTPVLIQYSSGTTGLKKGVEISEEALLGQISRYTDAIGLDSTSVIASWLPLYHDMGLICCYWAPLLTAAHTVQLSPFDWLANPQWFLKKIEQTQATHIWLPNFAYSYMARWYKPAIHGIFDLSSIRMITNCSEPVTDAAQNAFLEAFTACGVNREQLQSCYAMAETTFAMTTTNATHPQQRISLDPASLADGVQIRKGNKIVVSSGIPIADTEIQILSAENTPLSDGHVGAIHVRSPSLMSRYSRSPNHAQPPSVGAFEDGLFSTGDLGFTSGGHLYVLGRQDDMIIAYGANYDPVAIEETLWRIEGVIPGRAAAIGVTLNNPATTDIVILCETNASTIEANQKIAKQIRSQILTTFNFIPAVVKTLPRQTLKKASSGKISRKSAHRIFANIRAQEDTSSQGRPQELAEEIRTFLQRRFGLSDSTIENGNFLSSGLLDSLAIVDLILLLEEHIGKSVPSPLEVGFDKFESIRSICLLAEKTASGEYERPLVISDGKAHASEKAKMLENTPSAFSAFVLSSSNFKVLSVTELGAERGNFFNFYTGGASLPDFYAITSYIIETIKKNIETLIVSIDIERIGGFLELPSAAVLDTPALSRNLSGYLDNIDLDAADRRDQKVRERRINQIRFGAIEEDMKEILTSNGDSEFLRNGKKIARYTYSEKDLASGISSYFTRLHKSRKVDTRAIEKQFKKFSQIIDGRCDRIIFVIPPYHPKLFEAVINDPDMNSEYYRITDIISKNFSGTANIIDMREVSKFGGDPEDFMDATHPGPVNGARAARILKAYLAKTRQKMLED